MMNLKMSVTETAAMETDIRDEGVPLIVSRIVNHVERNGEFPIVHVFRVYIHEA